MPKARESNYDLLRICAAFAVVMLHVSSNFLQCNKAHVPTNCTLPVMLLNHVSRFAVPCFFMLSGAFILSDERNADHKYFYRKSFNNIGVTGVLFCALYVLYRIVLESAGTFVLHRYGIDTFVQRLLNIIGDLCVGKPYSHLWYLFTLAGLYFAAPFIIRLSSNSGGVNIYGKITTIFLALSSLSYITSEHLLKWDVGWQFLFLSYFIMGFKLRRWAENKKNNVFAAMMIGSGFTVNLLLGTINYFRGLHGLPVDVIMFQDNPFSYAPLAPAEVFASCLTFAGFSVMKVKRNYFSLAKYTFSNCRQTRCQVKLTAGLLYMS